MKRGMILSVFFVFGVVLFLLQVSAASDFNIIKIIEAKHLTDDKHLIGDVYEEVYNVDGVFSKEINDGEYVRVTFEKELRSFNDITILPKVVSGKPKVEVYEI